MKKLVLLALVSAFVVSCNKKEDAASRVGNGEVVVTENSETIVTTPAADQKATAVISFDKTTHEFGDLKKGESATYEFTITNTGEGDLIIMEAKASCGCTVPEKPEAPIKPGESAKMKVAFSGSTLGPQSKTVTVVSNSVSGTDLLTIKANVVE